MIVSSHDGYEQLIFAIDKKQYSHYSSKCPWGAAKIALDQILGVTLLKEVKQIIVDLEDGLHWDFEF